MINNALSCVGGPLTVPRAQSCLAPGAGRCSRLRLGRASPVQSQSDFLIHAAQQVIGAACSSGRIPSAGTCVQEVAALKLTLVSTSHKAELRRGLQSGLPSQSVWPHTCAAARTDRHGDGAQPHGAQPARGTAVRRAPLLPALAATTWCFYGLLLPLPCIGPLLQRTARVPSPSRCDAGAVSRLWALQRRPLLLHSPHPPRQEPGLSLRAGGKWWHFQPGRIQHAIHTWKTAQW